MKALVSLFLIALLFAGCAIHGGYLGHSIITTVELSQNNFKVVDRVSGSAYANKILGFGISNEKLYNDAFSQMVKNADLKGGAKALVNVATDVQFSKYVLWSRKTVTVSADVVEFTR